jgi:uncharacterized membrane protein
MNGYWKSAWPGWVTVVTMFAVAVAQWPSAPASVPTHWNWAGSINSYGGKFEGLLLTPIIAMVLWGLISTAPFVRPHKVDASIRRALIFLAYATLLIFVDIFGTVVFWINGVVLNMNYALWPSLLVLYAALGNLVVRAFKLRRQARDDGANSLLAPPKQ